MSKFIKPLPIVLFLFWGQFILAQSYEFFFNHLEIYERSNFLTNRSILKDSRGFVWISSSHNIYRFDGHELRKYGTDDGLHFNNVASKFFEDNNSNIWFFTKNKLICYIRNQDKFKGFDLPYGTSMFKHCSFKKKDNLLGFLCNGMLRFFDTEREVWSESTSIDIFNPSKIESFYDQNGKLRYIAVIDFFKPMQLNIIRFQSSELQDFCLHTLGNNKSFFNIEKMKSEGDSLLWASTSNGILEYHLKTDEYFYHRIDEGKITDLTPLDENHLLISIKGKGLRLFNKSEGFKSTQFVHDIYNEFSLSTNNISNLFTDRDGFVWADNFDGRIDFAYPNKPKFDFLSLSFLENESSDIIKIVSIKEDKNGNIWISTNGTGIYVLSSTLKLLQHFSSKNKKYFIFDDYVKNHLIDQENNHWVIASSGLYLLESNKNQFKNISYETVQYGIELKDGRKIFRTLKGNLFQLEKTNTGYQLIKLKDLEALKAHNSLFQNNEGLLYVMDRNSRLWLLDPETDFNVIETQDLESKFIRCFYEEPDKQNLWIGTSNGLFSLDQQTKKIKRFTSKDGISNAIISSILPDKSGNLWLNTNYGIVKFSPQNLTFHQFPFSVETKGKKFPQSASLIRSNGEFWVTGSNGIYRFTPEKMTSTRTTPQLYLSQIFVNYQELQNPKCSKSGVTHVSEIKRLDFSYEQNTIEFEFRALEYSNAQNISYQYMLVGRDKNWLNNRDKNNIRFENIPSGDYTLKVRVSNSDGVFDDSKGILSLEFHIATPFWKKWWFILIAISFISFIIWRIYKYQLRRLLYIERIRNQISIDLHDDIGASLSNLNILTTLVRQKISDKETSFSLLSRIEEEIQSSAQSLDDIIWSVNPKNDSLDRVLARIRRFASEAFEAKNINGQFDFPQTTKHLRLDMEKRRNFFYFCKEATNNLIKHAECQIVDIIVRHDNGFLTLIIKDDGKGFDFDSVKEKGNGLESMKHRANKLNAKFNIQSEIGNGTSVKIEFKIGKTRNQKIN